MAVTTKGFQGTISDVDMATQLGGHHLPTVRGVGDLAVTAVASARTVNVAAGVADSGFVKATNDGVAAGNIALAPPASGGKWYAVTVDRQWSPTNAATLRGDDLAVTDANGTIPTAVPIGVFQAAAALPNQPGTAGGTAGQRQVLALVYVRAADTTLTIFDMRARRTGAGVVIVPSLWALAFLSLAGHLLDGATVTVGRYLVSGVIYHESSSWTRVNGIFSPTPGTAFLFSGTASPGMPDLNTGASSITTIVTGLSAGSVLQFPIGHAAKDTAGNEARWHSSGTWRPFASEWKNATNVAAGMQGLQGNNGQDPGWASTARWRYVAGMVRVEWAVQLINGGSNGSIRGPLPTPADIGASGLNRGTAYEQLSILGSGYYRKWSNGNEYNLTVSLVNTNYFRLLITLAGAQNRNEVGNGMPAAFGDGDVVMAQFEYTPQDMSAYSG